MGTNGTCRTSHAKEDRGFKENYGNTWGEPWIRSGKSWEKLEETHGTCHWNSGKA